MNSWNSEYPTKEKKRYVVKYKDYVLSNPYVADFVLYNSIVLEVKSATVIAEAHAAQALSYLAVSGLKLALVINFGERSLNWKRIVL